ncbi:hypothetical protein Bhyg_06071 [Pseudolycoriella hygida]|uniref:F-box domain-containing protein n=1 Tax=Pseudolycoriella hygida TaxID=35572 RepID=A0A9Q0N1H4_9DIPT|nr:hypothetical protein Bhyg_06071 [Pseudolycoriella hygida]
MATQDKNTFRRLGRRWGLKSVSGVISYPPEFVYVPHIVAEKIVEHLNLNDVVNLVVVYKSSFNLVAQQKFKAAYEKNDNIDVKIDLNWSSEAFYRVLDNLGQYIRNVEIIGHNCGEVIGNDIFHLKEVFSICPNITSLTLVRFRTDRIQMNFFRDLGNINKLKLVSSRIGVMAVKLPKITEFIACIPAADDCEDCRTFDISQTTFLDLLKLNPQLKKVDLTVISSPFCKKKCTLAKTPFTNRALFTFCRRPMESFVLRDNDNRTYQLVHRCSGNCSPVRGRRHPLANNLY